MSTLVETLRARLTADSTVAGLVGVRIYPVKAPQGATLPCVVMAVVSDVPDPAFGSAPAELLAEARVQVDSYAKTYLAAHQVADAVDLVLAALGEPTLAATRETMRDLYDDEAELHRVSADYAVLHGA